MIPHLPDPVKNTIDMTSVVIWALAMFDHLPSIAAGMSILWLGIQMFYFLKEKHFKKRKKR